MTTLARRCLLLAAVACVVSGCGTLQLVDDDSPLPVGSPLAPASGSADGVRFEIYWATLPPDAEVDKQASLWRFVQEERLDGGLRRRLRRNGLRAGVVGGVPPHEVATLLNPRPDLAEGSDASVAKLTAATGVTQQEMTLTPGKPGLVNAGDTTPEATLLLADERGPFGKTFRRVQPVYRVEVKERAGGGRLVTISPELHHGQPRNRYVPGGNGITRLGDVRDERTFPGLRIEAELLVGEMLMVTSLPDSDSRLGGFFHRADGEVSGARKAIVVRMVQTPPDGDFAAAKHSADRPDF